MPFVRRKHADPCSPRLLILVIDSSLPSPLRLFNPRALGMQRNPLPNHVRGNSAEPRVRPYHVSSTEHPELGRVDYAHFDNAPAEAGDHLAESVHFLQQVIAPGDFAIDIGAQTGESALPLALAAGSKGLVLALEPNPFVFAVLAENARLNPEKSRIEARNIAATETDGQFAVQHSHHHDSFGSLRQPRWNLFRRRPTMQVEGRDIYYMLKTDFPAWLPKLKYVRVAAGRASATIMESIRPILSERRPTIACQSFRARPASERLAIYDFLEHLGYDVARFDPRTHQVEGALSRTAISQLQPFDLLATPRPKRAPYRLAA